MTVTFNLSTALLPQPREVRIGKQGSAFHPFIYNVFKTDERIGSAILAISEDRLLDRANFSRKLPPEVVGQTVDEDLVEQQPLLALFLLIVQENESSQLREQAADCYVAKFPEDQRFERSYAYLKDPCILLVHALILGGFWKCKNSENAAFYDEQIAGLFYGTVAFDKGDRISLEELKVIQQKEGSDASFPVINALEELAPFSLSSPWYQFTKGYSTPCMQSNNRLDTLFIPSRRAAQNEAIECYAQDLELTSVATQRVFHLPENQKTVVAVIGPYGVGKTAFIDHQFSGEKSVLFSIDCLSQYMPNAIGLRKQDSYFESMMLVGELSKRAVDIPCLLIETAAIDTHGLSCLLQQYSQNTLFINEIASEEDKDAVEHGQLQGNTTRVGAAQTSAKDAHTCRNQRILTLLRIHGMEYHLYVNKGAEFVEVAFIMNGELMICHNQKQLFEKLISG